MAFADSPLPLLHVRLCSRPPSPAPSSVSPPRRAPSSLLIGLVLSAPFAATATLRYALLPANHPSVTLSSLPTAVRPVPDFPTLHLRSSLPRLPRPSTFPPPCLSAPTAPFHLRQPPPDPTAPPVQQIAVDSVRRTQVSLSLPAPLREPALVLGARLSLRSQTYPSLSRAQLLPSHEHPPQIQSLHQPGSDAKIFPPPRLCLSFIHPGSPLVNVRPRVLSEHRPSPSGRYLFPLSVPAVPSVRARPTPCTPLAHPHALAANSAQPTYSICIPIGGSDRKCVRAFGPRACNFMSACSPALCTLLHNLLRSYSSRNSASTGNRQSSYLGKSVRIK